MRLEIRFCDIMFANAFTRLCRTVCDFDFLRNQADGESQCVSDAMRSVF